MSTVDMTRLVADMQRFAAEARSVADAGTAAGPGFEALLRTSIDRVNALQGAAAEVAQAFETGSASVTLPEVMIALQKASLSFQAMTEVRNHLVSAYQEIMNMPV